MKSRTASESGALTSSPMHSTSSLVTVATIIVGMVGTMLVMHATYTVQLQRPSMGRSLRRGFFSSFSRGHDETVQDLDEYMRPKGARARDSLPELFIYRRTRKTGSSSMLTALLDELRPLGYHPLYLEQGEEMDAVVRNEWYHPTSRRLFIAEHNHVTRGYHPHRDAVIADTVRDGYDQITSYCRYVQKVRKCDSDDMIACLRNENTTLENTYRWAGREAEDDDTYINLPLSSSHPALSTTVLRTVFPNVTLQMAMFNVKSSSCPKISSVKQLYDELYVGLDGQVRRLRERMLILAGYPYKVDKNYGNISIEDMMKEADRLESEKHEMEVLKRHKTNKKRGYSDSHHELIRTMKHWTRKDGKLAVKSRRK